MFTRMSTVNMSWLLYFSFRLAEGEIEGEAREGKGYG